MCSYLVVLCGGSLKTYGISFGHILMLFNMWVPTSLVLVGKSELLVTTCCFTKACVMWWLGIWGRKREVCAKKKTKEMPLSSYEWEKLGQIPYTTIYYILKLSKEKKKGGGEEKRLENPFIIWSEFYFFFSPRRKICLYLYLFSWFVFIVAVTPYFS